MSAQIAYGEQVMGRALREPADSPEQLAWFEAAHKALYEVCDLRERGTGVPQGPWEDDVRSSMMLADVYVISGHAFGTERGFKLTHPGAIANHLYTVAYGYAGKGALTDQLSVSRHAERGMLAAGNTRASIDWRAKSTTLSERLMLVYYARAALHRIWPSVDATPPTDIADTRASVTRLDPLDARKSIEAAYLNATV